MSLNLSKPTAPVHRKTYRLRRSWHARAVHMVLSPHFLLRAKPSWRQVRVYFSTVSPVVRKLDISPHFHAINTTAFESSIFAADSPASLGSHRGSIDSSGSAKPVVVTRPGGSVEDAISIASGSCSPSPSGPYPMSSTEAQPTDPGTHREGRPCGPSGLKSRAPRKMSMEEYKRSQKTKRRHPAMFQEAAPRAASPVVASPAESSRAGGASASGDHQAQPSEVPET